MKHLSQFIIENQITNLNEGLLDKLKNWFKSLFKDQETLKQKTLDVDVDNIKGPNSSAKLSEVISNDQEMKIINDPKIGFPTTSMIIKQKNKYLIYETPDGKKKEFSPKVDRYFYVDGNSKYDIGIIIYDDNIKNDNRFVNMINLEVIAQVNNKSAIEKYINQIFEDKIKKKFNGLQYISQHPRVKATLIKLGYKSENSNTNILFKKLK